MKRSLIPTLVVIFAATWAFGIPPGTKDEITERTTPFGSICRAGDDCASAVQSAAAGPMSGQQVYDKFCFACHASGVGGAPVLGDAAVWGERSAKGMDALMQTTLNGLNAMPAKGTCMTCSDDELNATVTYMLEQSQ